MDLMPSTDATATCKLCFVHHPFLLPFNMRHISNTSSHSYTCVHEYQPSSIWKMKCEMMEMKSQYSNLVLGDLFSLRLDKHLLNALMNYFSMSLTLLVDRAVFFLLNSLYYCFCHTFIHSLRLFESWYKYCARSTEPYLQSCDLDSMIFLEFLLICGLKSCLHYFWSLLTDLSLEYCYLHMLRSSASLFSRSKTGLPQVHSAERCMFSILSSSRSFCILA